jgi:hypothetical protein
MKKTFFSFVLLSVFSGAVFSQGCNPGWETGGFVFPTPDSMDCVVTGEPFSGAFQINMPSMLHGILDLDSMVIDSIGGLPPGITWFSYPSPLVIYGDSSVCISFIGTVNNEADTGTFPLTFYGNVVVSSASAGTQTFNLTQLLQVDNSVAPYYELVVIGTEDTCASVAYFGPSAIADVISASDWKVYPNPGNGNFTLSITAANGMSGQLEVHDMPGRLVYERHIETTGQYQTSLNLTNFSAGMYMVQFISASGDASVPKPLLITSAGLK